MKTKFNGILTLLLAFVVQISFAQQKTISGTVSDKSGSLPGVSILVKGTNVGTESDFDGKYSIKAKAGDVLVFRYLGYKMVQKTVGSSNSINVAMEEDSSVLDEIVVTAFGIKRKPDELTTSNQVVKAEELTKAGAQNLAAALTGKVSGLDVRQVSSGVNQDFTITLRGMRSFSANNEALVVIDGVPSTAALFFALDPDIIENVNVLKGANGAALYGPRGSNGVVIVNTKKGGNGSEKGYTINIKTSSEFESYAYLPERQTRYGQGWASAGLFQHFVYENGAWGPEFDGSSIPVGLPLEDGTFRYSPYETLGSDNIGEFFQTGNTQNYSASISGGNLEDGYANFSVSHLNREFIIEDDTQKRTTISLRAGKQLGKFSLEGNIQYVTFRTQNAGTSLYGDLLHTATNIDLSQFSDGNNATHWNGYFDSPYWNRKNIRTFSLSDRINASVNLGYKVNDNINIRSTTSLYSSTGSGYNYNNGYVDPTSVSDLSGFTRTITSSYGSNTSSYIRLYSDLIANFDYQLTEDFNLNANLGATVNQTTTTNNGQSGTNLTIPGLYNIQNVINTNPATDSKTISRQQAIFADVTLGYKDYLFLNATARNDWLSTLNGQNFFYPSAGVSFIPTKAFESLTDNDVIDRIKLSYSFVQVGNANAVSAYDTNNLYSQASGTFYGTYPFGTANAFLPSASITDPNLKPEFTNSHEFGLTAEFLKRKIRFDVSGYIGSTTDQISEISTSYASGLTSNTINIGAADTKGIEIDLGLTPIDTENWTLLLNASYAASRMEVTKVSDQSDEVQVAGGTVGIFAEVGEQFPIIKGSDYVYDPEGHVVVDTNGDPLVSEELQILGKTTPDYILNFNGSLRYKDFTLSVTADYRTGHSFYSGTKSQLAWSGYLVESAENGRNGFIFPNSVIETSPGVYTTNTSVVTGGPDDSAFLNYYSGRYSDIARNFVLDATALKVREISLSYTMPKAYLDGTGVSGLSVTAVARNPFTILSAENRGYADPEASNQGGNGVGLSTVGNYPNTRTFGLNLNLTF
ncbi:TonB-linked outer membrane protein, SusC/RagA family [Polaribacter sp. KT25b]|uniref:SusC/RagA family TonB-linked outer membrane protein n=1 Tax=Polaribacter sp. KT25b TaxID=1855336 RepID=UPI00087BCD20|nr:SusC/RagA family TonB-linked outer membrane protein [Polaribacter sp. KT25b]SDR73342.1 TonB-linked outer membrane protein, SusC/RagA family [Polaribacter sp. KT25b]